MHNHHHHCHSVAELKMYHTIRHEIIPLEFSAVMFTLIELLYAWYQIFQFYRKWHGDSFTCSRPRSGIQYLNIHIYNRSKCSCVHQVGVGGHVSTKQFESWRQCTEPDALFRHYDQVIDAQGLLKGNRQSIKKNIRNFKTLDSKAGVGR